MARGAHCWSQSEIDRLMDLRGRRKMDWYLIGNELDLLPSQCRTKYENECALRRRQSDNRLPVIESSDKAMIDRERRNMARLGMSLTAAVMGDPPPGWSALDKRRAVT